MSAAKHTPGPWHVSNVGWIASPFETICSLYAVKGQREAQANGLLIAAAPDLLAALRDCLAYMENDIGGPDCCRPERVQAHAAIAKATGAAA
jgi:hypothetical protein